MKLKAWAGAVKPGQGKGIDRQILLGVIANRQRSGRLKAWAGAVLPGKPEAYDRQKDLSMGRCCEKMPTPP